MLYIVKIAIQFKGGCRIIAIVVDSLFLEFYYPNFVVYELKKSSCNSKVRQVQFCWSLSFFHPLVIAFPGVVSFQGK